MKLIEIKNSLEIDETEGKNMEQDPKKKRLDYITSLGFCANMCLLFGISFGNIFMGAAVGSIFALALLIALFKGDDKEEAKKD